MFLCCELLLRLSQSGLESLLTPFKLLQCSLVGLLFRYYLVLCLLELGLESVRGFPQLAQSCSFILQLCYQVLLNQGTCVLKASSLYDLQRELLNCFSFVLLNRFELLLKLTTSRFLSLDLILKLLFKTLNSELLLLFLQF